MIKRGSMMGEVGRGLVMFGEFGFGWERLFEIVSGCMKQVKDG